MSLPFCSVAVRAKAKGCRLQIHVLPKRLSWHHVNILTIYNTVCLFLSLLFVCVRVLYDSCKVLVNCAWYGNSATLHAILTNINLSSCISFLTAASNRCFYTPHKTLYELLPATAVLYILQSNDSATCS